MTQHESNNKLNYHAKIKKLVSYHHMEQTKKKQKHTNTARRTRISDIRREELTAAALRCIAVKGYDRVTLDDVAKEAGFSQGIALYYFKNREALLSSAIESIWDDLIELTRSIWKIPEGVNDENKIYDHIREYYSAPEIDFKSIIENGIKTLLIWFDENPHIISVAIEFWSQVPRNPTITGLKDTIQPYIRNTSAIVFQEGMKRGVFKKRDPEVAAHTVLSVISGFALSHIITRKGDFNIMDLEKEYCDVVFSYLCE